KFDVVDAVTPPVMGVQFWSLCIDYLGRVLKFLGTHMAADLIEHMGVCLRSIRCNGVDQRGVGTVLVDVNARFGLVLYCMGGFRKRRHSAPLWYSRCRPGDGPVFGVPR